MLSFGRTSARDVLESLLDKQTSFKHDPLNAEIANACAIDAWSLCDWTFKEHAAELGFHKLSQFQKFIKDRCPAIALLQDVANASKHRTITQYTPVLKQAKRHDGAFQRSAFQADTFDVSALVLAQEDGSEVWFDTVLNEVATSWVALYRDRGWLEGSP